MQQKQAGSPKPPPAPKAPDYAKANREAIQADIDTLPQRRRIDAQARMGIGQFEGLGDADFAVNQAHGDVASANVMAEGMLDLQEKYGDDFLEMQRQRVQDSDPTGYSIREAAGKQIQENLELGGKLDADTIREIEQQTRRGQAARGNLHGNAPLVAEAMNVGTAAYNRKKQNLAEAVSFAFGAPLSNQFANVNQAQQGAAPFNPVRGPAAPSMMNSPSATGAGLQFASDNFRTQANIYGTQSHFKLNAPNPGMQMLGMGAGMVGGLAPLAFSSKKVKDNINDKEGEAYEVLDDLSLKGYDYKQGYGPENQIGFIAEDLPEGLQADVNGVKGVNLYELQALNLDATKTLKKKVEQLEKKAGKN